jgi:hypothetical protein
VYAGPTGAHSIDKTLKPDSFYLTVISPCSSTSLTGPASIQNFIVFAGQSQASDQTYTFNDTVSQQLTQPGDITDYCGEKFFSFELNN